MKFRIFYDKIEKEKSFFGQSDKEKDMDSGILVLDKSAGLTSQSAVTRVKRLFDTDKAGHAGTLDPMATGVLPILLGRAVKASEFLLTGDKHYRAGLLLGPISCCREVRSCCHRSRRISYQKVPYSSSLRNANYQYYFIIY